VQNYCYALFSYLQRRRARLTFGKAAWPRSYFPAPATKTRHGAYGFRSQAIIKAVNSGFNLDRDLKLMSLVVRLRIIPCIENLFEGRHG
jgi:hypothetical protein